MRDLVNALVNYTYKNPEIVGDLNPSRVDWSNAVDEFVVKKFFPDIWKIVQRNLKQKQLELEKLKKQEQEAVLKAKEAEVAKLKEEAKRIKENAEFLESELADKKKSLK